MQTRIEQNGDGFGLLLPEELLVTPAPRRPREGWAEAVRAIPQEALERDFEDSQAFRETPHEWDATGWQWPEIAGDGAAGGGAHAR